MGHYFLSYARKDQVFSLRLADDLISSGVNLWVDQFSILPSQQWDRAVEAALMDCSGLILVMSPHSVKSDNVADEISVALDRGKRIIPIMIADCSIPLRLSRIQYIDARSDYGAALTAVLSHLQSRSGASDGLPPPKAPNVTALDPARRQAVQDELASLIGPIASVMVRRASENASTEAQLRQILGHAIQDIAIRTAFVAGHSASSEPDATLGVAQAHAGDLENLARALLEHIGPIAVALVRRESRSASSYENLCHKLSDLIRDPKAKARFLGRALNSKV